MSHDPTNTDLSADPALLEEQLVAYLDGELDDEEGRRIEQLLASDPRARETLSRLEATWDLLGTLGRAETDETFTRSTLEMVAVAAEEDVQRRQSEMPRRRRRWRLIGGAVFLLAATAGFLTVLSLLPRENEQLLRDLPLLEELHEYRQIDDVDFLRQMAEEDLFLKPQEGVDDDA